MIPIADGIPKIEDYHRVLNSPEFKTMEAFSDSFIQTHGDSLREYAQSWTLDPLHTWSRQWEYPYVFQNILTEAQKHPGQSISVLDAGSGVTFFPFYLQQTLTSPRVTCCDSNPLFKKIFVQLRAKQPAITMEIADLRDLPFKENSFDIVYCISVLEHTRDYPKIIAEFGRVLKPKGLFILTFDIAVDGAADIPPARAKELLMVILKNFGKEDGTKVDLRNLVSDKNILTTHYIKEYKKDLLPWKHPFLSVIKSAVCGGYWPRSLMKNLTVYGGTYRKR